MKKFRGSSVLTIMHYYIELSLCNTNYFNNGYIFIYIIVIYIIVCVCACMRVCVCVCV